VVPLLRGAELLGVLDLDSPNHARFGPSDQKGLETVARIFVDSLGGAGHQMS
jgi:L-methionine (R)-S-oxide reductase